MQPHALITNPDGDGFRCTACGHVYLTDSRPADCLGAPVYQWGAAPQELFTERQLKEKGLIPGPLAGLLPYSKAKDGSGYLRMYRESEATPKPPLSPARQAAVDKMLESALAARTCKGCQTVYGSKRELSRHTGLCESCQIDAWAAEEKPKAVAWAREMLAADPLFFDTETTGLWGDAEIVSISVVDHVGTVLLDTYVKPVHPIVEQEYEEYDEYDWKHRNYGPGLTAFGVNGISNAMVANAPGWAEVAELLRTMFAGRTVIAFNMEFDHGKLDSNCQQHSVPPIEAARWECLMLAVSAYIGDWNWKYRDWRYQSLATACYTFGVERHGSHTAAGDCLDALAALRGLATVDLTESS